MIGWLTRRTEQATRARAGRILAALEDGNAHYVVGDLDQRTGINATFIHPALARLERDGLIETGLADTYNGPQRRWYRLATPPQSTTKPTNPEGATP